MRMTQAGEKAVSIWFSGEAVPGRRKALALVRDALAERGIAPWPETALELFSSGGDALLIARPGDGRRDVFFFPDLEVLLAALESCPAAESSLYWDGRAYILALEREGESLGLYEFGRRGRIPPGWELHAREQGMCVIKDTAVADLRRCFAT